ncbi:MAG: SDR family NAD(P)-dependent oxidoreductase [Anaerolineales bacterium]|jgi:NAD(P)-dependent dehydrogenase (short-subunit alcohol dehydrogenase family)|nr:SDR family NAD(P)-dependent oxidoreductase [Anaerolineales bacterium]
MKLPEELQFIENARLPQKTTDARLDGRLVVITGATSGVGLTAAKHLAQGGANLVIVCRDAAKAARVQAELQHEYAVTVDVVVADFARLAEVRKAAGTILARYPTIDVLINNAGLHNTHRQLTEDGIEMVFCVNHLASFLLTRLLLGRMLESAPARIIQVNSQGHRFGGLELNDLNWKIRPYKGLQGYGASKVAQLLTTWEMAEELEGSGVTINAMHPGEVRTNIGMNNEWFYRWYKRHVLWWILKQPEISGNAIYYLAAAPEMANVSGRFFNQTIDEKPAAHALDRDLGKCVWRISEEMTGLASKNERMIDDPVCTETVFIANQPRRQYGL